MRKLLIAGAVGVLAISLVAVAFAAFDDSGADSSAAQSVRRVGLMHVGTDHIPPALDPLKARLAELGWTEGKNIELIFANLEPKQAPEQARSSSVSALTSSSRSRTSRSTQRRRRPQECRAASPSSSCIRPTHSATA